MIYKTPHKNIKLTTMNPTKIRGWIKMFDKFDLSHQARSLRLS